MWGGTSHNWWRIAKQPSLDKHRQCPLMPNSTPNPHTTKKGVETARRRLWIFCQQGGQRCQAPSHWWHCYPAWQERLGNNDAWAITFMVGNHHFPLKNWLVTLFILKGYAKKLTFEEYFCHRNAWHDWSSDQSALKKHFDCKVGP